MKTAAELNKAYAVEGELGFCEMGGGPIAWIKNDACSATVALKGGQVLSWHPNGQEQVLWVSKIPPASPEQPVRGGVPICWPWFGPHPKDPSKPNHGFVRTRYWEVVSSSPGNPQSTELTLRSATTPQDFTFWPHSAELILSIIASATLRLELTTRNTGSDPFELTQALHTYFYVADIGKIEIEGLDGLEYLDKVAGYARKQQQGRITINGEVDRIYLNHTGPAVIRDAALGRAIILTKSGSTSSVVWNPWEEPASQLSDLGPDGYRNMLCVETSNAGNDIIRIEPGAQHTLAAEIQVASG